MIKECNIIYRNPMVMVVKYDGNMIQLPSSDVVTSKNTVFVNCENDEYTVVHEDDYKKNLVSAISEQNNETIATKKCKKTLSVESEK